MVVTPDIKFHSAVMPVDVEAEYDLLGFWDGGKPASAAVIYIRHKPAQPNGEETHKVRLLMSKARVTPSTPTVLTPRTELQGLFFLPGLSQSSCLGSASFPEGSPS